MFTRTGLLVALGVFAFCSTAPGKEVTVSCKARFDMTVGDITGTKLEDETLVFDFTNKLVHYLSDHNAISKITNITPSTIDYESPDIGISVFNLSRLEGSTTFVSVSGYIKTIIHYEDCRILQPRF
jgi:hypothetical protein